VGTFNFKNVVLRPNYIHRQQGTIDVIEWNNVRHADGNPIPSLD
jgi:hypothetical protein